MNETRYSGMSRKAWDTFISGTAGEKQNHAFLHFSYGGKVAYCRHTVYNKT